MEKTPIGGYRGRGTNPCTPTKENVMMWPVIAMYVTAKLHAIEPGTVPLWAVVVWLLVQWGWI